jgi:protein-disulfide isomerase
LPSFPRALLVALTVAAFDAFGTISLPCPALADSALAALVAKPVALPDMALGPANAPVNIVEYSSLTCPHCADFAENVFPMLQSKYIDTGKVRFVSREFPLEIKAVGASMLARCVANENAPRYFEAIGMLFKQRQELVEHTTDALKAVGGKFGMSAEAVEACVRDNALLDKIKAAEDFAYDQLKVDATPTFFINGERVKGSMSFEEFEKKLAPLLKR